MWTPDDFPGAENVPWQLLIRARYAHELDGLVASVVINHLSRGVSADVLHHLAGAVAHLAAVKTEGQEAAPEHQVGVLRAMLEFDDFCGTGWPRRWPPRPKGFEDLADPAAGMSVHAAVKLVRSAGSEQLQGEFLRVLEGAAQIG